MSPDGQSNYDLLLFFNKSSIKNKRKAVESEMREYRIRCAVKGKLHTILYHFHLLCTVPHSISSVIENSILYTLRSYFSVLRGK